MAKRQQYTAAQLVAVTADRDVCSRLAKRLREEFLLLRAELSSKRDEAAHAVAAREQAESQQQAAEQVLTVVQGQLNACKEALHAERVRASANP